MNLQRRSFLSQSFSGALGFSLAPQDGQPRIELTRLSCTSLPSPADALDAYVNPILSLQGDLVFQAFGSVNQALRECNELFKDLAKQVDALAKEISKRSKPRLKAGVQQLRELTYTGQAQVRMLNASTLSHSISPVSFVPLALVTKEVEREAQDLQLLPQGESTLSPAATRILNKIIESVRESIPARERLSALQVEADARVKRIREDLKRAEALLHSASSSIDLAERASAGHVEMTKAQTQAVAKTKDAVNVLKALKDFISGKEATVIALETIDALVLLLEGTGYWIAHRDELLAFKPMREDDSVRFELVSTRRPNSVLAVVVQDIKGILEVHCLRDSLQQVSILVSTILLPTRGWVAAGRALAAVGLGTAPRVDGIIAAVEKALRRCSRGVNSTCGRSPDFRKLAEAIAPLI